MITSKKKGTVGLEVQEDKVVSIPIWKKINLTIHEASTYSNIGVSTIRNLLQINGCPFLLKIGNKHLVKRKEFEAYLENKHYI